MDFEQWVFQQDTGASAKTVVGRLNKLEKVVAGLVEEYYTVSDESQTTVADIPEITRLQRENAELKEKIKRIEAAHENTQAEARRWKDEAIRLDEKFEGIRDILWEDED
jgi:molecular chaperone GrpE (heat shock protein)